MQIEEEMPAFSELVPLPPAGRTFTARRRVRLSDADARGRLRLDAVARYLQDVATDDVIETGWGSPDHFWLVRRTVIRQLRPISVEEMVGLTTWSSGVGSSSASRRTTLAGERDGLIEAESVWVHLGRELRPERMGRELLRVLCRVRRTGAGSRPGSSCPISPTAPGAAPGRFGTAT